MLERRMTVIAMAASFARLGGVHGEVRFEDREHARHIRDPRHKLEEVRRVEVIEDAEAKHDVELPYFSMLRLRTSSWTNVRLQVTPNSCWRLRAACSHSSRRSMPTTSAPRVASSNTTGTPFDEHRARLGQEWIVSFAPIVTSTRRILLALFIVLAAASCRRECSDALAPHLPRAQFAPETWLIDLGHPDFRTQLVSGWGGDERGGEQQFSFVRSSAPSSVIRVNRYGAADLRMRFRCAGAGGVTMLVNGVTVATTALAPAFAINEVAIPASRLRIGENRIEFRYRDPQPVAWDWIEFLEPRAKPNMRTPRNENDTIVIPYRSALRFELEAAAQSALVIDGIDVEGAIESNDRGRVQLTLRSQDGHTLASFNAAPGGHLARFALPLKNRTRVQLEITALAPRAGAPAATAMKLRNPRIVVQCR